MGRSRFDAEFGHYSAWIVDAIQEIGLGDPVPAACRGTGNPSLLEHLAAVLAIERGAMVLDVGVGLGGPAAWLVRERSCRLVGVDIMLQAARGAHRLFGDVAVAVASSRGLPFRDQSFDAAWALGVIEMLADKERAFREIVRVLVPGGRVVVYDFVATEPELSTPPAACRFESADDIAGKLEAAGFDVLRSQAVPPLSAPPDTWQRATAAVRQRIQDGHGGDARLAAAEDERNNFNRLRLTRAITEWEFVGQKARR
jgi:ubiquinone/menaquinone biosynthesis C-methylase UbiE